VSGSITWDCHIFVTLTAILHPILANF